VKKEEDVRAVAPDAALQQGAWQMYCGSHIKRDGLLNMLSAMYHL